MIVETRPYMRVLQALVRVYFENEQPAESAYVSISRLRIPDSFLISAQGKHHRAAPSLPWG